MSLNARERKQSSCELKQNYIIAAVGDRHIQADLGIGPEELKRTLEIDRSADPTMVWRLRDYLEEKILQAGRKPCPYSVLIENIYYPYR